MSDNLDMFREYLQDPNKYEKKNGIIAVTSYRLKTI